MEKRDGHAATTEYPHPFIHRVRLPTAHRIKGIILGSVLFPLRLVVVVLLFLLMWPIAMLRTAGLSEEELSRPIRGWRCWLLHAMMLSINRVMFFTLGFVWIEVKGRRADVKEAPALVVAPHSSFLDMVILMPTQLATVVSRSENVNLPVIGALLGFNQSVVVSRKDPESRRKAVTQIKERLTSNGYWPQMLIFPEGTTTNGTVLMKFKPGAFLAGGPVQPVLLSYPNKLDTMRWTYKGTTWVEALWHTMSQFYTRVTVEYLPVYTPSQEEKDDPNLYANNVQKLMASCLGLPATDYVMEGRVPVRKLGGLSLPVEPPAKAALSLLRRDGVCVAEALAALRGVLDARLSGALGLKAGPEELAAMLCLEQPLTAGQICALYTKDNTVDLRHLYLSLSTASGFTAFKSILHVAFNMFDPECRGHLPAEALSGLMGALLGAAQRDTAQLYAAASRDDQLTEEDLLRVLTTHPTYQVVVNQYLKPEEAGSPPPCSSSTNGKAVNNNRNMSNGNTTPSSNKKTD
ncbi:lysophospholipid acyltransferase LPCAT4 isoform X1 [Gadus morhua]|uniref:Lysophosphatidylcholine acyltransferase 4 n=2 Tax=Gadus morhua TaxID=8049 RepID=A0A8C4Z1C3_GADMO|nr:lysophospholipid acyltransferase LPCAT4 isoform X1 [Gadus morhua]